MIMRAKIGMRKPKPMCVSQQKYENHPHIASHLKCETKVTAASQCAHDTN